MENTQAKGASAAAKEQLAREFRSHLARQGMLCDRLEAVADCLPSAVNVQECLYLAQNMVPIVMTAQKFEEAEIFPLLTRYPDGVELISSIERLKFEHMGDEDYANQIVLTLRDFVKDRTSCNPETLAWMLRGFFDALRRHIAFEQEHVLPLLESGGTHDA
jgi:iron-sulfur cluster repair protein YtfE (RIC family)